MCVSWIYLNGHDLGSFGKIAKARKITSRRVEGPLKLGSCQLLEFPIYLFGVWLDIHPVVCKFQAPLK